MIRSVGFLAAAALALQACARQEPPAPVEYRTGAFAAPAANVPAAVAPAAAPATPQPSGPVVIATSPFAASSSPGPVASSPAGGIEAAPLAAPVAAASLPPPTPARAAAPVAESASVGKSAPVAERAPVAEPTPAALPAPPRRGSGRFAWPAQGPVISPFGAKPGGLQNDGINIALPRGAPVRAADAGVVAYAGNEIRGFGNLLLIKHDGGWMTAYGHNDKLLVKRGDTVKRGQVIAKAGSTGGVSAPQLHFELRRAGGAVDPLAYLDGGDALVSRAELPAGRRDPG